MGGRQPTTRGGALCAPAPPAPTPTRGREAALQARWAAGEWRGQTLRATTGEAYQVLYQGRPGGGAGPDFRDAVLLRVDATPHDATTPRRSNGRLRGRPDLVTPTPRLAGAQPGGRVYGDVELHLRPSGWRAHGHAGDPRYNGLALHIVLDAGRGRAGDADALAPTTLASGRRAPLVVLQSPLQSRLQASRQGQPIQHAQPIQHSAMPAAPRWPCADLPTRLSPAERHALLLAAGQARFEQRAAHFAAALREAFIAPAGATHCSLNVAPNCETAPSPSALSNLWPNRRQQPQQATTPTHDDHAHPGWSAADHILWLALAEALGYGRDRAALRAWGARLAPSGARGCDSAHTSALPALPALPALTDLSRVERLRLRGLFAWRERWATSSPWSPIQHALMANDLTEVAGGANGALVGADGGANVAQWAPGQVVSKAGRRLLAALRVGGGAVSAGRAVILAANVALPFAAAWATLVGDEALAAQARDVYAALPGAPSNQITREMARQLGLPRAPDGAAAQQGLHHLWATHCREKRCDGCPCGVGTPGDVWPITCTGAGVIGH